MTNMCNVGKNEEGAAFPALLYGSQTHVHMFRPELSKSKPAVFSLLILSDRKTSKYFKFSQFCSMYS